WPTAARTSSCWPSTSSTASVNTTTPRAPGAAAELLNRVQRAAVVAESELIGAADLELADTAAAPIGRGLDRARVDAERDTLLGCLRDSGYNVSQAARRLGVSRVTVYRLCRKHQLRI